MSAARKSNELEAFGRTWRTPARAYVRTADRALKIWTKRYGKLSGRSLIGIYELRLLGGGNGSCRWCSTATASGRISWHAECALVYAAAKGLTVNMQRELIPRGPCAACGEPAEYPDGRTYEGKPVRRYFDVDHRLALGIATRLADRRSVLRAWWIGNLQRLCKPCHRTKTANDRRIMRALDAGVDPAVALGPQVEPQMGLAL